MPRHSRIKSKTNIYHVMNRGLNKQLLFDVKILAANKRYKKGIWD